MNALRIAPHPTHQSLQEALDKVELLRSRTSLRTVYLIHMSHSIGLHREVDAALPPYVRLAYDGLSFSFWAYNTVTLEGEVDSLLLPERQLFLGCRMGDGKGS